VLWVGGVVLLQTATFILVLHTIPVEELRPIAEEVSGVVSLGVLMLAAGFMVPAAAIAWRRARQRFGWGETA